MMQTHGLKSALSVPNQHTDGLEGVCLSLMVMLLFYTSFFWKNVINKTIPGLISVPLTQYSVCDGGDR